MTRSEDPPGNVKHLRFGRPGVDADGTLEILKDFPGIKCIVLHTHGKRGEHPHFHVWWEGEKAVTNQTIRDRLKGANSHFKPFSGQNDWSFRNHDSWDKWASYVTDNLSHKVLLDYNGIADMSASKAMVPIAIGPLHSNPPPAIIVKVKKTTMREKLIYYAKHELGWAWDSNPSKSMCFHAAMEVFEAAFTNPEGIRMCRHLRWKFSDADTRSQMESDLYSKIYSDI